jgi:transcriptional regulator with XRE-family HTH domain
MYYNKNRLKREGHIELTEESAIHIGSKIRKARLDVNMSIKALAELSGLSAAAIQKVETNRMVPTITSLLKISRALGRKVSFFIQEVDSDNRIVFLKKEGRERFYSEKSKCFHEYIATNLENGILEGGIFIALPGGKSGEAPNSHPGEEIILCLKGRIKVDIAEKTYNLKSGDTLHFKSDIPHRWRNVTNSEARILWIYTEFSSS